MAAAAAQTSTAVIAELKEGEHKPVAETITLKLVPRRKKKEERVRWSEDVEEINEFSGKFKSKSRSRMWSRKRPYKAHCRYAAGTHSPRPLTLYSWAPCRVLPIPQEKSFWRLE